MAGMERRPDIGRAMRKLRLTSRLILCSIITSLILLGVVSFVSLSNAAESQDVTLTVVIIPDTYPPAPVTDLEAISGVTDGSINLSWTAPAENGAMGGGPVSSYILKYATFSVNDLLGDTTAWWNHPETLTALDGGSPKEPGETETFLMGGLTPGTTCYFAIKSRDEYYVSPIDIKTASLNQANAMAASVAPAAINDLAATPGAGYDRIDLSWTAPGDDGWLGMATRYNIKYATYNITAGNFDTITDFKERNVTVSGGNPDSETITGLASDTLYYFAMKTEDEIPNVSGISNIATAIIVEDTLPPRQPAGIKGILSADGKTMTISWSGVSKNEDGTACEDLSGYNIYRASLVDGVYTLVDYVDKGASLMWSDPEDIKGSTFYYMVRAKDNANNLSKISMIVDSSNDMNVIAVNSEEMSTRIVIPKEIKQILYEGHNSYGDDVIIEVLRNKEEENGRVIKSYSFLAKKGQTGKEIKNFVFERPLARISLTYEVENGYVKRASSTPANRAAEQLALFWFNGLEWMKLGGEVDEAMHLVSIKSKRIGKYMIKESLRASSFVIESIQPDKIFTPNGDGWNDYFEIQYANPKDGNVSGKIYDLKGALVAGMEKGANEDTLKWDGRDTSGNPAPGGVYIYQIEVTGPENKVINGTVVVAR
ncbi:MAG: gliding motility-associated C-terminal domain-containing protein [Elusimicrobiota bacterium]|nr:gliding motility-associated C-terminal domain-containing protein [Elusimicrobiota bacterium]